MKTAQNPSGAGPLAREAEDGVRPAEPEPIPEPAPAAVPWPAPPPADPGAGRLVELRRFIVVRRPLLLQGRTYQPGEEVPERHVSRALERCGLVVRAERAAGDGA